VNSGLLVTLEWALVYDDVSGARYETWPEGPCFCNNLAVTISSNSLFSSISKNNGRHNINFEGLLHSSSSEQFSKK